MKIKFVLAALVLCSLSLGARAQLQKGTWLPSVSLSGYYGVTPYDDDLGSYKNYSLGAGLGAGYMVADNWELGLRVNGAYSRSVNNVVTRQGLKPLAASLSALCLQEAGQTVIFPL